MKKTTKLLWCMASIALNTIICMAVGYWIKKSLDYEIVNAETGNEFDLYYRNILLLGGILPVIYAVWFFLASINMGIRHWIERHVRGSLIILAAVGVIVVGAVFVLTGKVYRGNGYYKWPWRLWAYLGPYLSGILVCCPYNLSAVMVYGYHNKTIRMVLKLFWMIAAAALEFFLLKGVRL